MSIKYKKRHGNNIERLFKKIKKNHSDPNIIENPYASKVTENSS